MAAAKASPFSKLKVAFAEMGESIGAVLLPAAEKMAEILAWLAAKVQEMPGWLKGAGVAIALLAAAIGPLLWMLGSMAQGLRAIKDAWDVARRVLRIGTWKTETAAIEANTIALGQNSAARAGNAAAGVGGIAAPLGVPGTQMSSGGKWGGWTGFSHSPPAWLPLELGR